MTCGIQVAGEGMILLYDMCDWIRVHMAMVIWYILPLFFMDSLRKGLQEKQPACAQCIYSLTASLTCSYYVASSIFHVLEISRYKFHDFGTASSMTSTSDRYHDI